MHVDDEKLFLENLEEFVMDEDKLVTYKWLSATLDIHVNTAKQLLYKYVMVNNKRKEGVHMTYLLSGILRDGCGMKVQIVREKDLDKAKSTFKLLTSEHIYSVQKLDPLADLNIFYGIDNLKSNTSYEDKLGSITYKHAVKRLAENARLAPEGRPNLQTTKVDNKSTGPFKSKPTSQSKVDPVAEDKCKLSITSDRSTNKHAGATEQQPDSKETSVNVKAGKNNSSDHSSASSKPTKKVAKSGIAMLFSKQVEKQQTRPKHANPVEDSSIAISNAQTTVDESSDGSKVVLKPVEIPAPSSKKQPSPSKETGKTNTKADDFGESNTGTKLTRKKEKTGKRHNQSTNTNSEKASSSKRGKKKLEHTQPAKKRKRIVVVSDDSASSDDDIFGNDSDAELEPQAELPPPSPEPESQLNLSDEDIIPPTPVVQKEAHSGRIRKRKLVDKTFEDEEGFIITKKEYVFESCSEGEEDKLSKEPVPVKEGPNDSAHSGSENTQESSKSNEGNNKMSKKQDKSDKQPQKKKKSQPAGQKTKQSSLMNFFTKS